MENQQQQQQQTGLCRAGCGFYGSAVTEGLCSKCFKDSLKRTQDTTSTPRINQSSNTSSKSILSIIEGASTSMDVPLSLGENVTKSDITTSSTILPVISKETQLEQRANDMNALGSELLITARDSSVSLNASSSSASMGSQASLDSEIRSASSSKSPNRCHTCKKRVGLTGFVCRCGGLYCGEHRYDKAHNCVFDYKTMEREEIRKNNPVVVSDKIQRI